MSFQTQQTTHIDNKDSKIKTNWLDVVSFNTAQKFDWFSNTTKYFWSIMASVAKSNFVGGGTVNTANILNDVNVFYVSRGCWNIVKLDLMHLEGSINLKNASSSGLFCGSTKTYSHKKKLVWFLTLIIVNTWDSNSFFHLNIVMFAQIF